MQSKANCSSSNNHVPKQYLQRSTSRLKQAVVQRNCNPINLETKSSSTGFEFKFVSESELNTALKQVRRANQKKQDEEVWQCFLRLKQDQLAGIGTSNSGVCELCWPTARAGSCTECGLLAPVSSKLSVQEEIFDGNKEKNQRDFIQNSEEEQCKNTSHVYQLGPGLNKRLQDLLSTVSKMTELLLNPNLRSQFEDEDVDRTIKRSLEFDAMFARNHLYEIQRLLKDTKHIISSTKSNNTIEMEVKISAALKSITQALQVYAKHVSKGSRVKYQQVLPIFQSITSTLGFLEQLSGQQLFPTRKEIEVSCSYLREVLLEISVTETKSVSSVSQRAVHTRPKHKPSADLSMYSRRHKTDWRRKSAYLARVKFGVPSANRCRRKCISSKETRNEKLKNDLSESDFVSQENNSKLVEKSQQQAKETSTTKEVPYRNATRAVPEDHITTMMEKIPHEPLEDNELYLDDKTFEALKRLNGSLPCETLSRASSLTNQTPQDKAFDLVKKASMDFIHDTIDLDSKKHVFHTNERETNPRPKTAGSSRYLSSTGRDLEKSRNVQLLYVTEAPSKTVNTSNQENMECARPGDALRDLSIDRKVKDEALWFHQKMAEYQATSQLYKDDKALGIVDRLANNILAEMIIDFQRDEMDQVVRTLYNLEFN